MKRISAIFISLCLLCGCAALPDGGNVSQTDARPAQSAQSTVSHEEKYSKIVAYGIDVSCWQESVDWALVATDNVDFAIIRAGFSGDTDTCFEENYAGATAAGIDIGVYFYCYAVTVDEAKADAEYLLSLLNGRKLDYPVFYDIEDDPDFLALTRDERTEIADAFCTVVEQAGYEAGIYTGRYWLSDYFDSDYLSAKYDVWLAAHLPEPPTECSAEIWQYSHTGRIKGIDGDVDLNTAYKKYK